jgi:hypothetical protein
MKISSFSPSARLGFVPRHMKTLIPIQCRQARRPSDTSIFGFVKMRLLGINWRTTLYVLPSTSANNMSRMKSILDDLITLPWWFNLALATSR